MAVKRQANQFGGEKGLTPKERKLIRHKVKNPDASLREAGLAAGYSPNSPVQQASKALNRPYVKSRLHEAMEKAGITDDLLLKTARDGLEAMETRLFAHEGEIVSREDLIAWSERREYLKLILQWRGDLKVDPAAQVQINQMFLSLTDVQLAQIAMGKATPGDFAKLAPEDLPDS